MSLIKLNEELINDYIKAFSALVLDIVKPNTDNTPTDTEDGITLDSLPTNYFVDDFNRADTSNDDLGSDWTVVDGGDATNYFKIKDGTLRAKTSGGGTEHRTAYYNGKTDWTTTFACLRMKWLGLTNQELATFGPIIRWDGTSITGGTGDGYITRHYQSGQDSWLQKITNGAFSTLNSDLNWGSSTGAGFIITLKATNDSPSQLRSLVAEIPLDNVTERAQTSSDTAWTSGRVGVLTRDTSNGLEIAYDCFIVTDDPFITMTGLPTGWKIKSSNYPDATTESGGTASMDCTWVPPDSANGYDAIEVLNASDVVQATFNRTSAISGLILPGTSFSYSA